jgi:hypothetical protein
VLVAVAVSVAVVQVVLVAAAVSVTRRRRRSAGTVAERALQARIEQIAAQERATPAHPDAVRDWMRPI